jgi:predicted HicB family RNase H-like nuclease
MCASSRETLGVGHVAYRIDDDLHARAKAMAAYKGVTFREWLERAIEAEVERQEAQRARERSKG